jgi:hypothetical protein
MVLKRIYKDQKCQIGRPLSRIGEDGRKWMRRPKLCTKSCRAVLRRRRRRRRCRRRRRRRRRRGRRIRS